MYYKFHFWASIITIVVVVGVLLGFVAYLILLERKIAAWVQDRLGPNRVGPYGLFQPLADGLKMFLKEDIIPSHVDRIFFLLAPALAMGTALLAFAIVPFGPTRTPPRTTWPETTLEEQGRSQSLFSKPNREQEEARLLGEAGLLGGTSGTDSQTFRDELESYNNVSFQGIIAPHVDIGILFAFAASSLAVYGTIMGGWSSNNKYSLMGGLRAGAQIISYEIPFGLSILSVVILTGSLNLEQMIGWQVTHGWSVFYQPLGFLVFLTSMFAETNRVPFDLVEAEQELVGGFHTEYSAMKFGLFYLGEYTHMVTTSFMLVTLFFGGWELPWIATADSWGGIKLLVFIVKMVLVIILYMQVRWTILRFRFDQLMNLAWKGLIPLTLLNLVSVMVVTHLMEAGSPWWLRMAVLFGISLVLVFGIGVLGARSSQRSAIRTTSNAKC